MFRRSFDSLEEIFAFTERFFARERIDPEHRFAVNLALEELFTNMVKYNGAGDADIMLRLQHAGDALLVRLSGPEAEPFDVSKLPEVDPDAPLESREPGGLGLHLVHKFVDSLDYAHAAGTATITFRKSLG
jgi:serine/threonine-protein kinase RsbW